MIFDMDDFETKKTLSNGKNTFFGLEKYKGRVF